MRLLSIIPRGFGGNPCDTQSPWFYVILSHQNPLLKAALLHTWIILVKNNPKRQRSERFAAAVRGTTKRGGRVAFRSAPYPTCFRVDLWGRPAQNLRTKRSHPGLWCFRVGPGWNPVNPVKTLIQNEASRARIRDRNSGRIPTLFCLGCSSNSCCPICIRTCRSLLLGFFSCCS
jgi:hypothetical protein